MFFELPTITLVIREGSTNMILRVSSDMNLLDIEKEFYRTYISLPQHLLFSFANLILRDREKKLWNTNPKFVVYKTNTYMIKHVWISPSMHFVNNQIVKPGETYCAKLN